MCDQNSPAVPARGRPAGAELAGWQDVYRRAADEWGCSVAAMLRHGRGDDLPLARWTAWRALQLLGATAAQLQRATGFDHSTILHGIARAKATPAIEAAARRASGRLEDPLTALGLAGLAPQIAAAIAAYYTSIYAGRPATAAGLAGLRILATAPATRRAALAALKDTARENVTWRMRAHAGDARLPWREDGHCTKRGKEAAHQG